MDKIENTGDIIIYQTEDGLTKINVNVNGDTVWLSLDLMAELFQRDKSTISRHIKNIFSEGELSPDSVVANSATTAADGNRQTNGFLEAVGFQERLDCLRHRALAGNVEGIAFPDIVQRKTEIIIL